MIGQLKLKNATITWNDDGAFASDDAPELAEATAGQWRIFCMDYSPADGDPCRRFLTETAKVLDAEVIFGHKTGSLDADGRIY